MSSAWRIETARLAMVPVGVGDLPDLVALKADPLVFAQMLGGVRSAVEAAEDLARDIQGWGGRGYGMWVVRLRDGGRFAGVAGLMDRPDGRGVGLRFAFRPAVRGLGLAAEAAFAALRFGHETAGLLRIIAVAREENVASRMILGSIGMRLFGGFLRHDVPLLVYESIRQQYAA